MEEQDRLLIQQLNSLGFNIAQNIVTVSQLQEDNMINIMLNFLQKMGMDNVNVSELRSLKGSKFRLANKIQENCQLRYGIRFEVQNILNPSVNESRKLLVNCLSKLSDVEDGDRGRQSIIELSLEDRIKRERMIRFQKQLSGFIDDSWVNPTLINHQRNEQRFLKLHILNILSKEPILKQVSNVGLRRYVYNSLNANLKQDTQNRNKDNKDVWHNYEDLQEKLKIIKKVRRQGDPEAFLQKLKQDIQTQQIQIEQKNELEQGDWITYQKGGRAINKAIKQMKQDDVEIQEQRREVVQDNQNIFTLELQFQQEDIIEQIDEPHRSQTQSIGNIEQELKQLRKQNREEIEQLQQSMQKMETKLETLQAKRTEMEENIQQKQDEAAIAKEGTVAAQKEMEQYHLVLQEVQKKVSENDQSVEIQKLTDENEKLQQQWFAQKLEMEGQITDLRTKAQEKKDRILQLKEKIKRLDDENEVVKVEGRKNIQQKEKLMNEFQKLPKEGQRSTYIKRIQDLSANLNKAKEDYYKVKDEISQLESQIEQQVQFIKRYNTELENLITSDPKRKDTIVGTITKQYEDYKLLFRDTNIAIREIAKMKIEVLDIEIKTDQIIGKGYKQSVEKMKADLNQIKLENQQMKK